MSALRLVCLGCGDAFSARWYSTCYAIGCDDQWLLVDCPHPIRKILRESGHVAGRTLDADAFCGLVLTHLHADHASGVEAWAYYHKYRLERRPLLLAHPDVSGALWRRNLAASMGHSASGEEAESALRDYFDVVGLSETQPLSHGPFQIACRRTCHPIPTFALLITAAERTVGISADTAFDPSLIEWLSPADLIVHETNYGIHTPYESLAALPPGVRDRMRLVHYPDDFDFARSVIRVLSQGECVMV